MQQHIMWILSHQFVYYFNIQVMKYSDAWRKNDERQNVNCRNLHLLWRVPQMLYSYKPGVQDRPDMYYDKQDIHSKVGYDMGMPKVEVKAC